MILKYVRGKRGRKVAIVVAGVATVNVMCDVTNQLKVNGGPYEGRQGSKKDSGEKESSVVPPDSSFGSKYECEELCREAEG